MILQKVAKLLQKLNNKGYTNLSKRLEAQVSQALIEGPTVQIDPSIQKDVQSAVDELKKTDPNFFRGVSKIVGLSGSPFGQVESTDPTIIHVNLSRIKQDLKQQMGSEYSPSNPEHQTAFSEALKRAIVETIAHEKGHVKDYSPEKGFPGGESPAKQQEQQMMSRLHYNEPIETNSSTNKLLLSKYAKRLCEDGALQHFEKEASQKIGKLTVIQYIRNQIKFYDALNSKQPINYIIKNAAGETHSKMLPYVGALLHVINEIVSRYTAGDLRNLNWYKKHLQLVKKYITLVDDEWNMILSQVSDIEMNIGYLEHELSKAKQTSIVTINNNLQKVDNETHLAPNEMRERKMYVNLLLYKIPDIDDKAVLSNLLLSSSEKVRDAATKRLKQFESNSPVTAQAQSTPYFVQAPGSGQQVEPYHVTGNNPGYPMSTREQELRKKLEEEEKKKKELVK